MPTAIDKSEVQRLLELGASLIEVLPSKEYEKEHLPGASNIPLTKCTHHTTAALQHDRPVIVYCYDMQ